MASIKTVLMEILSTFDAKSRTSAKQLRDQLHLGWPVSNSSVAMQQLGKELRDEMKQSLEVVSGVCRGREGGREVTARYSAIVLGSSFGSFGAGASGERSEEAG